VRKTSGKHEEYMNSDEWRLKMLESCRNLGVELQELQKRWAEDENNNCLKVPNSGVRTTRQWWVRY
jgi:DNA-binding transcriptional MerR regulator